MPLNDHHFSEKDIVFASIGTDREVTIITLVTMTRLYVIR